MFIVTIFSHVVVLYPTNPPLPLPLQFTVWDVGGQPKLRPLWRHYYYNTQAIVFVVDAADTDRLQEAGGELTKLMLERELRDVPLLIYANKQVG